MLESKKVTYPCTDLGDGIFDPFVGVKAKNPSDVFATEDSAKTLMRPMCEVLWGKKDPIFPSPARLRTLWSEQWKHAHALDSALFQETWYEFVESLTNPSLLAFEEQYGFKSRYFIPWQRRINLPVAREMAFGYGLDWDGRMVEVDHLDPMFSWLLTDPMARYLRERAVFIARHLKSRKHIKCSSATSLALGHVGFDTTKIGIDLENAEGSAYDAVILDNVSASHPDLDDLGGHALATVIDDALKIMQPGATLFFDLYLNHWVYRRNLYVFNWNGDSPYSAMKDPARVAYLLEQIARNRPIVANFHVDTRNDQPVAALVSITKQR